MNISLIILIVSVVFAILSQRKKVPATDINSGSIAYRYYDFNYWFFILSFLSLMLLCFFSKNGDDIPAYVYYYSNWTISDLLDFSFEVGYKLLCFILRFIFKNPYIGIGIIKFLSIGLFFQSVYLLRNRINVGFSVFAYVCILYVHNFHLLRIMLAVGIVYLAYAFMVLEKNKAATILLFVSVLFHYSSAIVLLAYLAYRLIGNSLSFNKLIIVSTVLVLVYLNMEFLVKIGVEQLGILSKYSLYISDVESGSGMAQFILFVPILYIIITLNKTDMSDKMYILCSVIGIMSLFAGSLGYIFEVIGRTTYYFNYFVIMYGASMPLRKDKVYINAGFIVFNLRTLLMVVYILIYLGMTYVIPGKSMEILTDYQFFWR